MAHKDFYRKNLTHLKKNFRTNNLLGALFAKEIITDEDREQLKCEINSKGQIAAAETLFLDMLSKKPDIESMYDLCEVLYENDCQALTHFFAATFQEIYHRHPDWNPKKKEQGQCNRSHQSNPQINDAAACSAGPMGDVRSANYANAEAPPGNPAGPAHLRGRADMKLTREDLEFIKTTSDYVFCIEFQQQTIGTGFVLGAKECSNGPRYYILTNHHVYDNIKKGMHADPELCTVHAVFDFQERGLKSHKVPFDSRLIAWSSELDYAMILLHYSEALVNKFGHHSKLSKFIICQDERPRDQYVLTLIGHPRGEKQTVDTLVVCNSEDMHSFAGHNVYQSLKARIFYRGTSYEGSSGSPCFDIKGRRLHCMQCGCLQDRSDQVEHGVFLYEVVKDIYHMFIKDGFNKEDFNKLFPEFNKIQH